MAWPLGLMDKAFDFELEDSRFESWQGRACSLSKLVLRLTQCIYFRAEIKE